MPMYRILLIEDAKIAQYMALQSLLEAGCMIDVASSGQEAIDQFEQNTYDALFMDLGLPDMDGFSATEAIRNIERATGRARTPIIALTAHEGEHVEMTCLDHDMDDFLVKPLTAEQAVHMLNKHKVSNQAL